MRFLYKRPRIDIVSEELKDLLEVMVSDTFIYLDLFVFSFIFTVLLSPVFHSLTWTILFFFACYGFFSSLYYFCFSRKWKKN